jgi:hypothetical protein
MTSKRTRTIVISATLAALTAGGVTIAEAASGDGHSNQPNRKVTRQVMTPDDCIRLNGGDYNACNVGNSGAGNLPYRNVEG